MSKVGNFVQALETPEKMHWGAYVQDRRPITPGAFKKSLVRKTSGQIVVPNYRHRLRPQNEVLKPRWGKEFVCTDQILFHTDQIRSVQDSNDTWRANTSHIGWVCVTQTTAAITTRAPKRQHATRGPQPATTWVARPTCPREGSLKITFSRLFVAATTLQLNRRQIAHEPQFGERCLMVLSLRLNTPNRHCASNDCRIRVAKCGIGGHKATSSWITRTRTERFEHVLWYFQRALQITLFVSLFSFPGTLPPFFQAQVHTSN